MYRELSEPPLPFVGNNWHFVEDHIVVSPCSPRITSDRFHDQPYLALYKRRYNHAPDVA